MDGVVIQIERAVSEVGLAAVLFAAGAELLRVERADRDRISFVLAPTEAVPDLFAAEVEHHAGRLRVGSRDVLTALHGLRSLLRATRIDPPDRAGAA